MSKKLTVGSDNVTSLYVGTQKVKKIYAGSELVYESTPPAIVPKGTLISMNIDGSSKTYRVLSCENTIAKVIGCYSIGTVGAGSSHWASTQFPQLFSDYYDTFTNDAKNAIIAMPRYQEYMEANKVQNITRILAYQDGGSNVSCAVYGVRAITDEYCGEIKLSPPNMNDIWEYVNYKDNMTLGNTSWTGNAMKNIFNSGVQTSCWTLAKATGGALFTINFNTNGSLTQLSTANLSNTSRLVPVFYINLNNIQWSIVP